ncbi:uncharacterized protein [Leuresthes tenuis]|uniref:uncharacterized protein isoform X2 n=1 Tax=Leuresthes tenuis TaxID=355514 RepID=UPI003B5128D4
MRALVPLFVFLAVAGFHTALSASLETPEKEDKNPQFDGLAELQKIDMMEFEAAQKTKAAQINITEEQNEEDGRYLEAAQDGPAKECVEAVNESTEEARNSDAAAREESESESSEDTDGRQRREHHETVTETVSSLDEASQDSTKEQVNLGQESRTL